MTQEGEGEKKKQPSHHLIQLVQNMAQWQALICYVMYSIYVPLVQCLFNEFIL